MCRSIKKKTTYSRFERKLNKIHIKSNINDLKDKIGGLRLSQCETRSIRAVWTREMVDEISSFRGIDEISELEQILLRELNSQGPS